MARIIILVLLMFCFPVFVFANGMPDSDFDGVPDRDENEVYKTDPYNADTDGDGYSDWIELIGGYSPHSKGGVKLEDNDLDNDGLNDKLEMSFKTDINNTDTDGDGYSDGDEVKNFYNPLSKDNEKLKKRIEVDLGKQGLSYFLGDVRMGTFLISSGLNNSTPKGHFEVVNKYPKAWSSYGLWMPYWMAITGSGKYGIHELPVWPNGYREGEDHLGTPVSHGCIRLGLNSAEFLYNWADLKTPIFIY